MTSNVGSALAAKPGVGFTARGEAFDADRMRELVEKSFRPEFVNRIDRPIVVFRPFNRRLAGWDFVYPLSAARGGTAFQRIVERCVADPQERSRIIDSTGKVD